MQTFLEHPEKRLSGMPVVRGKEKETKMKKRYETEQQILDKIDGEKERNLAYLKHADELEAELETMKEDAARTGRTTMLWRIMDHRREINRLRRICNGIIENRLPKLKNKLSEFRTPQLAAIDNGDPSIPVK